MKNLTKIITRLRGGWTGLVDRPIKLTVEGYMPLCIESIGTGPRGLQLVSITHYYEQNGDLCRDPDITCEITADGRLLPVSYQQDSLGLYQEAVFIEEGKTMIRPKLVTDLQKFMRQWDRNLDEQDFTTAEEEQPDFEADIAEFGEQARCLFPEYNSTQSDDAACWILACLEGRRGKLPNERELYEQILAGLT